MTSDPFPVYCRYCHKQIAANALTCSHCGKYQGLAAPQIDPPQTKAQQPTASPPPSSIHPAPTTGASTCFYCGVVITAGDYFCRACGKPLTEGVSSPDNDGVGRAYGISAMWSLFLGCPHVGILLGIFAMARGAKGLGCSAILLSVISIVLLAVLGGALIAQLIPLMQQQNAIKGLGF